MNNTSSLVYMGANYVLAIVIFVGARIVRNRQGIDLSLINKEIPVEYVGFMIVKDLVPAGVPDPSRSSTRRLR